MATKTFKIGLSNIDKQNMAQDIYEQVEALLFDEYDSSETYHENDFVVYNDKLYICIASSTTGTWDATKWQEAKLQDLVDLVNEGLASINGKANTSDLLDGTIVVAKAQVAEGLSTNVGTLDKTPFAYMTSGGQTDVETGYQRNLKLVGSTIVKNQLVNVSDTTSISWNGGTYSITSGKITVVCNATESTVNAGVITLNVPIINGHKYLILGIGLPSEQPFILYSSSVSLPINAIQTASASGTVNLRCYKSNGFAEQTTYTFYLYCIDLTQMFGSNDVVNAIIGNDTSKQVANLMLFLGGWLPTTYDTGTLIPSKSAYLKSVMYNQWDEEWELGSINFTTGENEASNDRIRSKNYIRVEPNTVYYYLQTYVPTQAGRIIFYDINKQYISAVGNVVNATFTTPMNCAYVKFTPSGNYGTTYNHDICIFIYWDGSKITYEPYEEKIEPLPNIEINGILKVDGDGNVYADGDELYPDGTGKRRYGVVDLSTLSWTYSNSKSCWYANLNLAKVENSNPQMISEKYEVKNANLWYSDTNGIATSSLLGTGYNAVICRNGSSTTQPSGYLVYELATETDIASTSFNPNLWADDFGTLQMLDENNAEIVGLQGCEIFYKANVSGFAESLYVRTNGDSADVVVQSEIDDTALNYRGYQKVQDLSSGIVDSAGLTYAIKKAYKIGNQVFLTIKATNETGNEIAMATALFSLSNELYQDELIVVIGRVAGEIIGVNISQYGLVSCSTKAIPNGQSIYLTVSYAVA